MVKAVPRKHDDGGGSNPESSSSSPDRYIFHSSQPTNVSLKPSCSNVSIHGGSAPDNIGLSWISVLKGPSPEKIPSPKPSRITAEPVVQTESTLEALNQNVHNPCPPSV